MNYELSSVEKRALNTRTHIGRDCQLNPQMYTHSHTPTMVLGGGGGGGLIEPSLAIFKQF